MVASISPEQDKMHDVTVTVRKMAAAVPYVLDGTYSKGEHLTCSSAVLR